MAQYAVALFLEAFHSPRLTLHYSSVVRCGGLARCPAVDTNPPAALANSRVISGRTTLGRLDGLRRNAEAAAWQTAHLAQVGCGTRVFGDRGVCYSAVQLHFLEYPKGVTRSLMPRWHVGSSVVGSTICATFSQAVTLRLVCVQVHSRLVPCCNGNELWTSPRVLFVELSSLR